MNEKTMLRKIIEALYTDYIGSAAEVAQVTIIANGRILYKGKANEIPDKLLNEHWVIVSIIPEQLKEYDMYPDYNKPKIIEVA